MDGYFPTTSQNARLQLQARELVPEFHVRGQLDVPDLADVKTAGFNSVICLRPDGEADRQPPVHRVLAAAQTQGLKTGYLPIARTGFSPTELDDFRRMLLELPAPVLAYCGSGARAEKLFNALPKRSDYYLSICRCQMPDD